MDRLKNFAFVWLVGVATILAVPGYRALNNISRTSWNEDARLAVSHEHLNTAIDKIGSGVAETGSAIGKVQEVLTDEATGTLPTLTKTVYGLGYSLLAPDGDMHAHIANFDRSFMVASGSVLEASRAVQDTAEHTTQLEDAAAGEIPALGERLDKLSLGGENLLQAWTLAGNSVNAQLPLLLKDADKVVRIGGFIGKDIHTWTFRATKPQSTHSKLWGLGLELGKACLRFC